LEFGKRPLAMSKKADSEFTRRKGLTDMYTKELMKQILDTENLNRAIKQVRKNKGKPGVDKMTVDEVKSYFVRHEYFNESINPNRSCV